MMWLDKKEWLLVVFCVLLIVPGIVYYSTSSCYVRSIIDNPGMSDTIRISPTNADDKKLIVKLAGASSSNYALKLNLFYKTKDPHSSNRVISEIINIPAGSFSGSFTRNFYPGSNTEKAEIIFIPEAGSATGKVKIEAGIF